METLYPSMYESNSNWCSQSSEWTREENKKFERALAMFDEHEPDRWGKVAAMIPGKSVFDVIKQYKELEDDVSDIEAGKVPIPGYLGSSFSWELIDDNDFPTYRKRPLTVKSSDQQRKKGVPWTEEEHRRFLLGLLKHGKGDWRNISRNFVVSKTPTQVASHAQKYFIRQQVSGVKDKRRPSIHDITTVSLKDTPLTDDGEPILNPSDALLPQQKPTSMQKALSSDWKNLDEGSIMVFDSTHGDLFLSSPYGISPNALKFYAGAHHEALVNPHNYVFQMPSPRHQVLG